MSKKTKKLEGEWLSFTRQIMPRNASAIQRQEMQRSFYAGASAMLGLIVNMDDGLSEEEAAEMIGELQSECADFMARVGRDR